MDAVSWTDAIVYGGHVKEANMVSRYLKKRRRAKQIAEVKARLSSAAQQAGGALTTAGRQTNRVLTQNPLAGAAAGGGIGYGAMTMGGRERKHAAAATSASADATAAAVRSYLQRKQRLMTVAAGKKDKQMALLPIGGGLAAGAGLGMLANRERYGGTG